MTGKQGIRIGIGLHTSPFTKGTGNNRLLHINRSPSGTHLTSVKSKFEGTANLSSSLTKTALM
jgi:hypothetical protein